MAKSGGQARISDTLWQMDQAWTEDRWHALCSHLEGLTWEEATWSPMQGRRTILDIVTHLGLCKIMYWEYAFGPARMTWPETGKLLPKEEDMGVWRAWLQAAHEQFRTAVLELTDASLLELRLTNWGEDLPTRSIIHIMIEHDLYHAGEINYIRGLYRAHLPGALSP